jgi:hypothetical protein
LNRWLSIGLTITKQKPDVVNHAIKLIKDQFPVAEFTDKQVLKLFSVIFCIDECVLATRDVAHLFYWYMYHFFMFCLLFSGPALHSAIPERSGQRGPK